MNSYLTKYPEYMKKNLFTTQVFQCVAYITHKSPTLQELFLKWTHLSSKEKILLNYMTYYIIEKSQMELYSPVIQGLNYWNTIQDLEGACGFNENPLDFKLDLEEEKRIFQLILVLDQVVTNILLRPSLCDEIQKFKNPLKYVHS